MLHYHQLTATSNYNLTLYGRRNYVGIPNKKKTMNKYYVKTRKLKNHNKTSSLE